jgi:hypothetical protein
MTNHYSRNLIFGSNILLGLFIILSIPAIKLPQETGWSYPEAIPLPMEHGANPVMVSDSEGNIHAVWVGNRGDFQSNRDDALYYSRWNNGVWSQPVSILIGSMGGIIYPSIGIDQKGYLHVVWEIGGSLNRGTLYYGRVHSSLADSSRNWSTQQLLTDIVVGSDMKINAIGDVYIVYANRTTESVEMIISQDGGLTWAASTEVYTSPEKFNEYTDYSRPRLSIDSVDNLYVVWIEDAHFTNRAYSGVVLYFSSSFDGGLTWGLPIIIDSVDNPQYGETLPTEWINLIIDKEDNIHLVWDGPLGYRYHQISSDRGESWQDRQMILPYIGYAGWNALTVDDRNIVHMVSSTVSGLFYLTWENGIWSDPTIIPRDGDPHFLFLDFSFGNRLILLYQNHGFNPPLGEYQKIIFQTLQLPYSGHQIITLPTAGTENYVNTQDPITGMGSNTPTPGSTFTPVFSEDGNEYQISTSLIIVIGVTPVFLLIAIVMIIRVYYYSKRN